MNTRRIENTLVVLGIKKLVKWRYLDVCRSVLLWTSERYTEDCDTDAQLPPLFCTGHYGNRQHFSLVLVNGPSSNPRNMGLIEVRDTRFFMASLCTR